MNNAGNNPIQELWQSQPVEGVHLSVEEIRQRAAQFERRIYRRNAREYVAGALPMLFFAVLLVRTHDTLSRIAFALLIAGMGFVLLELHRKGASSPSAAPGATDCVQFFRRELERQRDLLGSVWKWYLGPLVPGLVMLSLASAVARPQPASLLRLLVGDLVVAGVFLVTIRINARAARCLERQIEELRATEDLET